MAGNSYTVRMHSEEIERLETRMAYLEQANTELSDVVYRQQLEIRSLRATVDALMQRLQAMSSVETPRTPEEERPPHY
jgi:SlyX protein